MAKGDISTYNEDGQWKNKVEGSSRAANTHGTKAEAQAKGRDLAQDRKVEHVIKNQQALALHTFRAAQISIRETAECV